MYKVLTTEAVPTASVPTALWTITIRVAVDASVLHWNGFKGEFIPSIPRTLKCLDYKIYVNELLLVHTAKHQRC